MCLLFHQHVYAQMERHIALNSHGALNEFLSYHILLSRGLPFNSEKGSKQKLAIDSKLLPDMTSPNLGAGMYSCQDSSQILKRFRNVLMLGRIVKISKSRRL